MSAQTVSELRGVLDDIRRVLESVDWGASTPERKPAVVIGLSIGKVAIAQRLSETIERDIARQEIEATERAQITAVCDQCGNTNYVAITVNGEERLVRCRTCGPFSHTGAAA